MIIPEHEYGDIKCNAFAVAKEEQNCGLGKMLRSSILLIIPGIKRLLSCPRITNTIAQKAYVNWGFVIDNNPKTEEHHYTYNKDHWVFFEYRVDNATSLQETAETLIEIK